MFLLFHKESSIWVFFLKFPFLFGIYIIFKDFLHSSMTDLQYSRMQCLYYPHSSDLPQCTCICMYTIDSFKNYGNWGKLSMDWPWVVEFSHEIFYVFHL